MHIIFGKEQAEQLSDKYTVLELDTMQFGNNGPVVTAYCAVEKIPFGQLAGLESAKTLHNHLLINYRGRAWSDCLQALDNLQGLWGGELDSFYQELRKRINNFVAVEPPADWTPVIQK